MDKWYVADLNKMINWKKFKADGATPARKKDMLVLWYLVQGGGSNPDPSKRSEEEIYMYGEVDYEFNDNLCKGDKQHQVVSVLI